jgi:hypothetical protein
MTLLGTSVRNLGAAFAIAAVSVVAPVTAFAGAQAEEHLASSVVNLMSQAVSDQPVPAGYINKVEGRPWVDEMSRRLASRITDPREREHLATVHYEAMRRTRPQLVLGVITRSAFRKYAISTAVPAAGDAFWTTLLGASEQNLFICRTNLLRLRHLAHYLISRAACLPGTRPITAASALSTRTP